MNAEKVKKYTDDEIFKALECCSLDREIGCAYCPLYADCMDENVSIMEMAIDLVKRLTAENKNLKGSLEQLKLRYDNAKAEVERLKIDRDKEHDYANHYARMCVKAKAEVVNEFEKRVTESASHGWIKSISEIAKELLEEEK